MIPESGILDLPECPNWASPRCGVEAGAARDFRQVLKLPPGVCLRALANHKRFFSRGPSEAP